MNDFQDQQIFEQQCDTEAVNYDTALCRQFIVMGGTCLRDGNMYGAVIGDLPTGCAGFEKTRAKAIQVCMHNFYNEEAKIPGKKEVNNAKS